jgi:hypothetical protein
MFSSVSPSVAAGKMRQIQLTGDFWYYFTGSHAASCMHFQGQIGLFGFSEGGVTKIIFKIIK